MSNLNMSFTEAARVEIAEYEGDIELVSIYLCRNGLDTEPDVPAGGSDYLVCADPAGTGGAYIADFHNGGTGNFNGRSLIVTYASHLLEGNTETKVFAWGNFPEAEPFRVGPDEHKKISFSFNYKINKETVFKSDTTYAGRIGSSVSHPAIGDENTPVYVNDSGILTPCTGGGGGSISPAGSYDVPIYIDSNGQGQTIQALSLYSTAEYSNFATHVQVSNIAANYTVGDVTDAWNGNCGMTFTADSVVIQAEFDSSKIPCCIACSFGFNDASGSINANVNLRSGNLQVSSLWAQGWGTLFEGMTVSDITIQGDSRGPYYEITISGLHNASETGGQIISDWHDLTYGFFTCRNEMIMMPDDIKLNNVSVIPKRATDADIDYDNPSEEQLLMSPAQIKAMIEQSRYRVINPDDYILTENVEQE